MKRIIAVLGIFALTVCLCCVTAFAEGNRVNDISVDAVLDKSDGSAVITQVWKGDFNEGTEVYFPFKLGNDLKLEDFTVSDKNGKYKTLDSWDVDRSFKEKARTCGINKIGNEDCEVCWGISSYGANTYTVQYTVKGIVGNYPDNDGFLFRFVNSKMNTTPTKASVKIRFKDGEQITDNNCKIWAFGYDGEVQFDSGNIVAYTNSDITEDNHLTLLVGFEKGVFAEENIRKGDGTFEELKEGAFDGSDYKSDDDSFILKIIFTVVGIAFLVAVAVLIYQKVTFSRFCKKAEYHRDVPCFGDMNAAYTLAKNFGMCKESGIIAARIVKMIDDGCVEPIVTESDSAFGSRSKTELHFLKEPSDGFDLTLYGLMMSAAGDDSILQQKEMEKFCKKKPELLRSFIDRCLLNGTQRLPSPEYRNGTLKSGSLSCLTELGKKQLAELVGYRKYLLDFSLIKEREITETAVWQEMLTYATLLGIADKVAAQLKKVYPQYVPQIEEYEFNTVFAYGYCTHMYSAMVAAEQIRNSGGGGSASFGGGGGFSGGGFGGGTR